MTAADQERPAARPPAPAWQRRLRDSAAFRAGQAVHRRLLQRWLGRRAAPMPPPAAGAGAGAGDRGPYRCLVVAPHPDDETLGCGGYLQHRGAEGAVTTVVVVTDGRHSHRSAVLTPDRLAAIRQTETRAACALLGVHDVRFLGLEEGTLATPAGAERLGQELDRLFDPVPDEVLLPSAHDGHPDHRVVNEAVRARLRAWPGVRAYEYPVWFWDAASWTRPGSPAWRKALDVLVGPVRVGRRSRVVRLALGPQAAVKRAALAEYRSQTTNLTGEPGWATFEPRFLDAFGRADELFFVLQDG